MIEKDNFHIFEWNDSFGLYAELQKLIDTYTQLYGDFAIQRIHIPEISDFHMLASEITWKSFLTEKQVFLISWATFSNKKETLDSSEEDTESETASINKTGSTDEIQFWENILLTMNSENICIFISPYVDRRQSRTKALCANATVHSFIDTEARSGKIEKGEYRKELISYFSQLYPDLKIYIPQIIDIVWLHRWSIASEIEKIHLYSLSHVVHESDIISMVASNYEKSVFDFIDAVFSEKPDIARTLFLHAIETTTIYAFFYALLSNLRNTIFVNLFQQEWLSPSQIESIMWVKPYVVTKWLQQRDNYHRILQIYHSLINVDIALKSGKLISDNELSIIFSIERVLFLLKYPKNTYNPTR